MVDNLTGEQHGWECRCEQHVWDCRWAKLAGVRTPLRLGNATLTMMWACDQDRDRQRSVEDDECAQCIHWYRDGLPH
jgi:hypothetical protein